MHFLWVYTQKYYLSGFCLIFLITEISTYSPNWQLHLCYQQGTFMFINLNMTLVLYYSEWLSGYLSGMSEPGGIGGAPKLLII